MNDSISCDSFTQFLVDQQPVYDELILADIRPTDSWIGNIATGTFAPHSGVTHRLDRMNHVAPNTTKVWNRTAYAGCVGHPCDKTEHCIGWGSERVEYYLEEQSWSTPLLCFDSLMHVTHSEEQFEQIITDILRPSTAAIMSMFLRKRALTHASQRFYTSAAGLLASFTFAWTVVGDEEYFCDCSVAPNDCGKLTPQALQVRHNPLMLLGYGGKNPFKEGMGGMIELVTDIETCWELDKLGGQTGVGGTPSIAGNWRFTEWGAANAYWRYGFSGQVGNFLVRTDWAGLRFNYVGDLGAGAGANRYRYQLILPYTNITSGGAGGDPGLKSVDNPDFQNAHFAITYIMHKKGLTALVADSTSLNPEMPFAARDFAGKWQFVMDNLGSDGATGCVIENKRRNKGQFIGDFKLAIRPEYTEFINVYFHRREPMCIPFIAGCAEDQGYPVQDYNSCPPGCEVTAEPLPQ
jgi:hypothetical protein